MCFVFGVISYWWQNCSFCRVFENLLSSKIKIEKIFMNRICFKHLFSDIIFSSTKNRTTEENIIVLSRYIIYVSDFEREKKMLMERCQNLHHKWKKLNLMKTCSYRKQEEHDVGSSHLLLSDYVVLVHSNANFSDESIYTYIKLHITTYAM